MKIRIIIGTLVFLCISGLALGSPTYETVVMAPHEKRDDKTKTVGAEEFQEAGTGNDPIKAVQNLPGAATPSFYAPILLIEGSAPEETVYTIEGFRVPNMFHFGGFSTIIQADVLDRVDFLSVGYGPEYGQALGGYVNAWTASPSRDRIQGSGFVDIFNLGGIVQGPTSKEGSFSVSARGGYVGAVAAAANGQNALFKLTSVPVFTDGTFIYQHELSPVDTLKIVTVGSYDKLDLKLFDPDQQFSQRNEFVRVIPEFTHRSGVTTTQLSLAFGIDSLYNQSLSPAYSYLYDDIALSSRLEVDSKTTDSFRNIFGLENTLRWPRTTFSLPTLSGSTVSQGRSTYFAYTLSPYWRMVIHPENSKWTITPGVRSDSISLTGETIPQPRLGIRYELDPTWALHSSMGMYSQPPPDPVLDPSYGNPSLMSERSWHASLGVEKEFRLESTHEVSVSLDGFYKYFQNLVSPTANSFDNSGYGRAFGGELMFRADLGDFRGWMGYTLARSTRGNASTGESLFGYDQTHILTLIASYSIKRLWRFSARIRAHSQSPNTPLLGGSVDGIYLQQPGSFLAQMMPASPNFQFDLRADKKWMFKGWSLLAYLDVQNVTYSRAGDGSTNIPVIPVIGVKGEF